jgi:hypothetical protein
MRRRTLFSWLAASLAVLVALVAVGVVSGANPNDEQLPPAKQAVESAITALRAKGQVDPMPKGQPNPNSPEPQPPVLPTGGTPAGIGILFAENESSRPPTDRDDQFTNSWSVFSPTLNVDAWAGSRGNDPSQGFVMVVVWNTDRTSIIGGGSFDTPRRGGAVRIVGATGRTLALLAADGTALSFEPIGGTFR